MLSSEQAEIMLSLQQGMNARVDPQWIKARYPYLRAVAIEGAEAIEHHGWKWWKMQKKDLAQLQMELIDIWHFILSEILLRSADTGTDPKQALHEALEAAIATDSVTLDGVEHPYSALDLVRKLELLIAISVVRRIELSLFASIMSDCDLDWTELFRQYVGKNVLNMFRQDKGYKQGSYQKMWNGREDNECLVEIIHKLNPAAADFKEAIYRELELAYPQG